MSERPRPRRTADAWVDVSDAAAPAERPPATGSGGHESRAVAPHARGISYTDAAHAGELRLRIDTRGGRSYAREQYHEGALRVLRPHYADDSGQVGYVVINPGGGYLGSDAYDIDITLEAGASLLLTTQSATKVYRTPQGPATQTMRVTLGAGAVLESLPDQLIVYREGSYSQRTDVRMHPGACLLLAEIVTPGWDPAGATFGYDELRLRTSIVEDARAPHDATEKADTGTTPPRAAETSPTAPGTGRLWALDQLRVVPGSSNVHGIGFMEGHSHAGQLLVADARVDDTLVDEVAELLRATGLRAGLSRIGRRRPRDAPAGLEGFAVRALADDTEALASLHLQVANLLRRRWRAQPGIDLRKY